VALWIVADRSASVPDSAGSPAPTTRRTDDIAVPTDLSTSTAPTAARDPAPASTETATFVRTSDPGPSYSDPRPPEHHRTRPDDQPPPAVRDLHVLANSHESVTVGWGAVHDRSGIAYYEATLNGIPAGETAGRQLTVDWFNDDMSAHFVQVRAVDGAGNHGRRSRPLMITRPAEPVPDTTPDPSPSPTPAATPPAERSPAPPTGSPTPSTISPTPGSTPSRPTTAPAHAESPSESQPAPRAGRSSPPPTGGPSASAGTLERRDSGGASSGR
jgi:hypothetical protein